MGDAVDAVSVDKNIYLISYETPQVTVLDGTNDHVSRIKTSNHLWAIAANAVTKRSTPSAWEVQM